MYQSTLKYQLIFAFSLPSTSSSTSISIYAYCSPVPDPKLRTVPEAEEVPYLSLIHI